MKTDTSKQLLDFIRQSGGASPSQIAAHLKISLQMVHRHLKALMQDGKIQKSGSPPHVLYRPLVARETLELPALPVDHESHINQHYETVTPSGEQLSGMAGFKYWAERTGQHRQFTSLAKEYVEAHQQLESRYRNTLGLIDARFKVEETFGICHLDAMYYEDFYSIPKFGKTRVGQQVFLGKSGQDIHAIEALATRCRPGLLAIIKKHRIDAVAFAPHSIPRKLSFLKEFQRLLALPLPGVTLIKSFPGNIPIAQKSLNKLADRIENAENTIFMMKPSIPFKRILLIDDAVGSGATLNACAEKLKKASATFVCGYAICGSLKGFDVISEV